MKVAKVLNVLGWIAIAFQVLALMGSIYSAANGARAFMPIMTHSAEAFGISISWWAGYLAVGLIGIALVIVARVLKKKAIAQEAEKDAL